MPRFKCWDPDNGGEPESLNTEAIDAETAAEVYAEFCYHGNDHCDSMEVNVRDEAGVLRSFTVDVDFSVDFSAYENTPGAEDKP